MTQADEILNDLKRGMKITPKDALYRYGCMRLGARIYDLKQRGHDIRKVLVPGESRKGTPTRYAEYWLHTGEEANEPTRTQATGAV